MLLPAGTSANRHQCLDQRGSLLELLSVALLGIAAYLIGSISPSYILVQYRKSIDLRQVGSRNAGTLNTFHQLGPWWALLVLIVDGGKGAIAVLLPAWTGAPDWAVFVTGPMVIVGHNWTVLLRFRGGKGAACLIGICLAIAPTASMLGIIPGVIAVFLSRNAIVGLVIGFAAANVLYIAAWLLQLEWLVTNPGWQQPALCMSLTFFVAFVYGISIRSQLLEALRQRSLRKAFYGS